ncbi:MAG: hypothetical protein H0U64_02030 [Gemmatimonadaceae bacterium]|nr:hypothetical protein [Gemmatimonadaceae bacterium]
MAVSGVKLLGVANEVEAEAKIKELQNTQLQITGATGKATVAEAMAVILDWKTRADNEMRLTNKVATLTEESRVAKRDESIERMSREGTLPPARHDWARSQFATAEQVETFCAGMPKGFFANINEPASAVDSLTLDASERKICASLGISEAEYLEQKKLEHRKVG